MKHFKLPTVKESLIVQFINKPCPFELFGISEQFNFVIKLVALSGNFDYFSIWIQIKLNYENEK
jgi:hypothetical protein